MDCTNFWSRRVWLLVAVLAAGMFLVAGQTHAEEKKVRLVLLSGQSNMVSIEPEWVEAPLKKAFPDDEIIVVKFAKSGRPIRNWVPTWKSTKPGEEKKKGAKAFYVKLNEDAEKQLAGRKPESVTFIWMQGERDSREGYGKEYGPALEDLHKQLQETYGREDVDFVLGRLSDHGLDKAEEFPGWVEVRESQETFAKADPKRRAIVDTDKYNETGDGLHYDKEGRQVLANRFAEESIRLIKEG